MWLSNTATTAMMLPIANAILESLFGDLETLKQKCKSPEEHESAVINGTCFLTVLRTKNQRNQWDATFQMCNCESKIGSASEVLNLHAEAASIINPFRFQGLQRNCFSAFFQQQTDNSNE